MSELVMPLQGAHFGSRFTDRGVSDDAQRLREAVRGVVGEMLDTVTLGRGYRQVMSDLDEAVHEADEELVGPSERTIALAVSFLEAFPTHLWVPDAGVDIDGDIVFEWRFGRRRRFNVAIQDAGTITYSGIVGPARFHGEEQFDDEIPAAILEAFQRLLDAGTEPAA